MIRNAQIYINYGLLSQLKCAADVLQMNGPEEVLELWLSERLEKEPAIQDRDRLLSAARREAVRAWEAKWLKREADELP